MTTVLSTTATDVETAVNPMNDVAAILSNFSRGDAVAKVKACATFVEAIEALAAIFFPGVAAVEIPTGAIAALATLAAEYSEGQFKISGLFLGTIANNAGEAQGQIITDRFNR